MIVGIILDGALVTDRATLHDLLAEKFDFPDYYGRNLDALYDLLTEDGHPRKILLRGSAEVEAQLGGYGIAFLETLRQAAEENPALEVAEEE
jgi:ribonuclease inhibitor